MPQMAPLNRLTLLLIFSLIVFIISIINYTIRSYTPFNKLLNKNMPLKSWKW